MPRPKTISDEDVLGAALDVLARNGMDFTLSELARRVGLSRATLIQRFGDRDAILRKMAAHEVAATRAWIDSLPVEHGEDALWRFLELIVNSMGTGEGFSARVQIAAFEARDPILRSLASKRYSIIQDAIAARLPQDMDQKSTSEFLHSVIAGATMQWVVTDGTVGLADFVLQRLRWALDRLDSNLT